MCLSLHNTAVPLLSGEIWSRCISYISGTHCLGTLYWEASRLTLKVSYLHIFYKEMSVMASPQLTLQAPVSQYAGKHYTLIF